MYKLEPTLGNVDYTSVRSVKSAEKSVVCLRPWAMAIADPCQRKELLGWLDYYEDKIRVANGKLAQGDAETALQRIIREVEEKKEAARVWEVSHPFPKMPQCEDRP